MSLEGHFCWENCDEGPHGCICGNDCPNPRPNPAWREAWRRFQDERLIGLDPDGPGWPSRFEMFVAGFNAGSSRPFTEEDVLAGAEAALVPLGNGEGITFQIRAALDAVTARHTKEDKE